MIISPHLVTMILAVAFYYILIMFWTILHEWFGKDKDE